VHLYTRKSSGDGGTFDNYNNGGCYGSF